MSDRRDWWAWVDAAEALAVLRHTGREKGETAYAYHQRHGRLMDGFDEAWKKALGEHGGRPSDGTRPLP